MSLQRKHDARCSDSIHGAGGGRRTTTWQRADGGLTPKRTSCGVCGKGNPREGGPQYDQECCKS